MDPLSSSSILILGNVPVPKTHPDYGKVWRHPGRWVFDQALALSQHTDYKVTLLTLVKGATCDFEERLGDLRIVYLKAPSRFRLHTLFLRDVWRLRKFIRQESPDLVHAHGTEDAYGLSLLGLNTPKVLTGQGLYRDVNQGLAPWYSPPYLLELLEGLPMRSMKEIIVKSKHVESLTRTFFPKLRYTIIPNTLSSEFLTGEEEIKSLKTAAFIGSVSPHKGFSDLRKGLELLSEKLEFHVFGGSGDQQFVDSEIGKIRAAGHEVIEHGWVDAQYLADKLKPINLLIAPSHAETFGNQVIEAMLCLCHCVVTASTGMAENVSKYGGGTIVGQCSPVEIAEVVMARLSVPLNELEMESRRQARQRVIDELGPKRVAGDLKNYYQTHNKF